MAAQARRAVAARRSGSREIEINQLNQLNCQRDGAI
jgi:hypothetical protein